VAAGPPSHGGDGPAAVAAGADCVRPAGGRLQAHLRRWQCASRQRWLRSRWSAFRRSGDGDFDSFGASTLAQAQPWPLVLLQLVAAASETKAAGADGGGPAGADGCGPVGADRSVPAGGGGGGHGPPGRRSGGVVTAVSTVLAAAAETAAAAA
jgi:hypothetical protein